jgi:hypothetical protein
LRGCCWKIARRWLLGQYPQTAIFWPGHSPLSLDGLGRVNEMICLEHPKLWTISCSCTCKIMKAISSCLFFLWLSKKGGAKLLFEQFPIRFEWSNIRRPVQ